MAGRRSVCNNNNAAAMAVAMAAALLMLALLFAAGEAEEMCNVDMEKVVSECRSSCSSSGGTPSKGCCAALRHADFRCLCRNYWGKLRNTPYASCATIPSKCNIPGAPTSC